MGTPNRTRNQNLTCSGSLETFKIHCDLINTLYDKDVHFNEKKNDKSVKFFKKKLAE